MEEVLELLKIAGDWAAKSTQAPTSVTVMGAKPDKTGFGSEFSTPGNRVTGIVDKPKPKRKSDDFKPLKISVRMPTPGQAFLQGAKDTVVEPAKGLWRAIPKNVRRFGLGSAALGLGATAAVKAHGGLTNLQEEQERMSDLNMAKNRFQYVLHNGAGEQAPDLMG